MRLIPTALANEVVSETERDHPQDTFPLDLVLCEQCSHLQLRDLVDPARLFREYVYVSGTSPVFVAHFKQLAEEIASMLRHEGSAPKALEIGSNDGTLLRMLQSAGFEVLGIDPAQGIATSATNDGIPTKVAFFDEDYALYLERGEGAFDVIVANNVLAHVGQLSGIFRGISYLLRPNGFVVFEVSYLGDVVKDNLFDTIYHEHTSYHALRPLVEGLPRLGLKVFHVDRISSHGGSIRVFAQRVDTASRPVTDSVSRQMKLERGLALGSAETYQDMSNRITRLRNEFSALMSEAIQSNCRVAGFGAPAKATTLCYQLGINASDFKYIIDDNPLKQGKYSPGLHIPIRSRDALKAESVDRLVVFTWNFADSIITSNKHFLDSGGKFIVPLPQLRVVSG
jgi:SAM-dependent methyltransferase